MNVTVAILGLALLILVHEAGHFFVSLAVGMRPRKFYVGFPPALVKVRRKGIEYGIGAIPLGGFVKIPGMHRPAPSDVDAHFGRAIAEQAELGPPATALKRRLEAGEMEEAGELLPRLESALAEAELTPAARRSAERGLTEVRDALGPDAYWRQRTWKRVAAILAGPATNLVFAIALLAAIFMLGIPTAATSKVDAVLGDSPAARAGLQAGDQIVAVNGKPASGAAISLRIRGAKGSLVRLTVLRDGRRVELPAVQPEVIEGAARLGFVLAAKYERSNPLEATELATRVVWRVTKAIGVSLADLVTGENRKDVASAVGIVQGSSQALESGIRDYLEVLALISLSLALLNLLPLLPLDGGHIAFAVIEGIRGRSVGREVYERASMVGIVLVLFLFMIGLSNDIDRIQGDS
jgi:regulator of sigma E protease